MEMNFFAALRATRAAVTHMLPAGGDDRQRRVGQLVLPARRREIDYGAAKAALVNLAKSLAQEFGPRGVRVNCVSPGPVSTDLWLGTTGVAATVARLTGVDRRRGARRRSSPAWAAFATGRFTTPEEVATLVTLLASPRGRATSPASTTSSTAG